MNDNEQDQYFDEYTGIKNHANRLKGWFAPIHETKLRLNYTYYNILTSIKSLIFGLR